MKKVWGEHPAAQEAPATPVDLKEAKLPERPQPAPGEQAPGVNADDGINKEALRTKVLVTERPDVSYDDIKGQDAAVREMKKFDRQVRRPEIYASWGAEMPRGMLLFGPPGTGKTMLVQALVGSAQFPFLNADCSDINNKYFGNPERYAAALFDIAEEEAAKHPSGYCVLFLDEVDALLKQRDDRTFDAAENVLSIFLTRMNGLKEGSKVIIIGATNRPDKLDEAFLSRMFKVVKVELPDAKGVSAILEARCGKRIKEGLDNFGEVDFKTIGQKLVGMSGRELEMLANDVVSRKADEEFELVEATETEGIAKQSINRPAPITTVDIIRAAVSSTKILAIIGPERVAALKAEYGIADEIADHDTSTNSEADLSRNDDTKEK